MFLSIWHGPGSIRALREGGTGTEIVSDPGARVYVDEYAIRLLGSRLSVIDPAAPEVEPAPVPEPEPEPVSFVETLAAEQVEQVEPDEPEEDGLGEMSRAELWRVVKARGLQPEFKAAGLKYIGSKAADLVAFLRG